MFKKIIAAALSSLLLAAPQALAADLDGKEAYPEKYGESAPKGPSYSVIAEIYGGIVAFDENNADDFADTPGELEFGFRAHFGGKHAFQVEALAKAMGGPRDEQGEEPASFFTGGAHYIRRFDDSAVGAYANLAGGGALADDDASIGVTLAAQYAKFVGRTTFFAQAGFYHLLDESENNGDVLEDLLFANIGARYFFSRNMKLELNAAYGEGQTFDPNDADDVADLKWLQLGAEFERQFETYPVSFVIGYTADFVEAEDNQGGGQADVTAHTVKVGFKFNFNSRGPSLFKLDREGAGTFKFTDTSRPISFANEIDDAADDASGSINTCAEC
ncbi:MAG: hypothetical protein AAF732_17140 [Pseudomonadota bacterium]